MKTPKKKIQAVEAPKLTIQATHRNWRAYLDEDGWMYEPKLKDGQKYRALIRESDEPINVRREGNNGGSWVNTKTGDVCQPIYFHEHK